MLNLLSELIGPIIKWVILAIWEVREEKSHELVEIDVDPDLADRWRNSERM
jgi:hypothetical protein